MNLLLLSTFLVALVISGVGGQLTACPATSCFYDGATYVQGTNANDPLRYIAVGGFFDIHEHGANLYQCSSTFNVEGFLAYQAFLWRMNMYRNDLSSRNIELGAIAYDVCDQPAESVENLLSFSTCKVRIRNVERNSVVAYIGPYGNYASSRAGTVASGLEITMISPTATHIDSERGNQDFLLRLTPSFDNDVMAVAGLLARLNVSHVLLVHDNTDMFWQSAYMALRSHLASTTICISYDGIFNGTGVDATVDNLDARHDVRYVVPFLSREKLATLMSSLNSRSEAGSFIMIVTSDVGRDLDYLRQASYISNNTLIVESVTADPAVSTTYNDFFSYLSTQWQSTNASAQGNILAQFKAANPSSGPINGATLNPRIRASVERTLQAVDVVYAGITRILADCNGVFCDTFRNQQERGNNIFNSITAGGLFNAASKGLSDGNIRYNVYHAYVDNALQVWKFDQVFTMSKQSGSFVATPFGGRDLLSFAQYRNTFTGALCSFGECCVRIVQTTTPMAPDTTTPMATPMQASSGYGIVWYPTNQDITGAYLDQPRDGEKTGTRFDDNDQMWVIALGVLAGMGILAVCIIEIYILYKFLGTRMNSSWRTMWLGQLLLFGILLAYLTLFAYLFTPTKATCGITRFGVGVSYAFIFAVLLVKLMVILTSKNSELLIPGEESPNYLKGIYQFLMFAFAAGVQVVINVQWLITIPPDAVKVTNNIGDSVWICNHYTWEVKNDTLGTFESMTNMADFKRNNFENHTLSLVYIMVLILITTILSLNAHGIITNHRESVFIGISAGFSIPIWLAWGLVGGLNDDHDHAEEFGDACIAFGLFLTASLVLFAMFLPKVRQLVNMGVEGIYLEDDRETYYGGSVIMAPPSYKSKGANSVIYVNNQGIYSEPVVIGNGDPSKDGNVATHLRHPGSTYSAPPNFTKKADSTYGGSRVLRVTDDLRGRHPQKRPQSEVNYGSSRRSNKGMQRSRSQTSLGAL